MVDRTLPLSSAQDAASPAGPPVARWGRALVPVLGLALCIANALGAEVACFTTGCAVYASYEFLGLSFWVWGAGAFTALLAAVVADRWRPGAYLALATAVLLADLGFLLWQVVFLPCSSCLAAALLIGLAAGVGWLHDRGAATVPRALRTVGAGALALWMPLFAVDAIDAARESAEPWPIYGDPDTAAYSIWFSMSCDHCRETLQAILDAPGMTDEVVMYPVAKDEHDLELFQVLFCGLNHDRGLWDVLDETWSTASCEVEDLDLSPAERRRLRMRLAWNKALLVRSGHHTVPVLTSSRLIVVDDACDTGELPRVGGYDEAPAPAWLEHSGAGELCEDDAPAGCSIE